MNKRYIDFVPVKGKKAKKPTPVKKTEPTPAEKPVSVKKPAPVKKTVGPEGPLITKFLRNDKIEKRPLSKTAKDLTVAPKTAVEKQVEKEAKIAKTEEKEVKRAKKSPEQIIMKPESDSKVGMIVAVILTIILGAAAGTVAFLLLPK